ncbi:hypothetical protein T4D_7305 [Trichinella pseudospiralis]|uniref:Uncharacterized protein n=1 Tax=Trichinella pseudospiralis TaxID=6337 RepID=A0A0V1G1N7_TRIPS|nr:hypothetical protein T4D_7305 [Trichinella pseudospiralis]
MVEKVDEEWWKKLQFLSAISLLCCVIVVGFCVVLSRCSFVSIDKCSPFWNKTGVRCFLSCLLHVREGTCVVLRDAEKYFFECIREENVPGRAVQSNNRVVQCSTVEIIGAVNNEPATSSNHSARDGLNQEQIFTAFSYWS